MVLVEASEEKYEVLCSLCLVHDARGWPSDASRTHRSQGGTESFGNWQVHSQTAATPRTITQIMEDENNRSPPPLWKSSKNDQNSARFPAGQGADLGESVPGSGEACAQWTGFQRNHSRKTDSLTP